MKKTIKKVFCILLALVLAVPLNLMPVQAAGDIVETLNPETRDASQMNYFSYVTPTGSNKTWTVNAGSEAYVDLGASDDNANQYYYTVSFYGSAISIYAIKGPVHGIVKYTVDDGSEQTVDLYNASRTSAQSVYSVSGLTEGRHTLKAVTQTTKTGSKIVNQVSYAKITHQPYAATEFTLGQTGMSLYVGQKQKIAYTMIPSGTSDAGLVFSSNNDAVASVSGDGTVTAKAEGTAEITVSGVGTAKKVTVNVKKAVPALGGTITDKDTQHTQDTYSTIRQQNVTTATLTAWKNDKASSELVLYSSNGSLSNVQVTAGDFQRADGSAKISADNVTTTFIKSTRAYNGPYLGYGDPSRRVPEATEENRSESSDILYQDGGAVSIDADRLQPVWVEVSVPEDAPAGLYTGTLTVSAAEIKTPLVFTYKLIVQDLALPDTTDYSYDIGIWQYPYSSAEYYNITPFSEEHLEILRSLMEQYKEAGGNMITATIIEDAWNGQTYSKNDIHYPSMVKWTKESDGSFTYDYSDFDAWVSLCKEMGIAEKVVIYSIAPWHSSFTYWENGTMKKAGYTAGSDSYNQMWSDFLTDFTSHLDEKGWFESCYLAIDERNFGQATNAFTVINKIKNKDGKSLKTAGDMDSITDSAKKEIAKNIDLLSVGDTAAQAHSAVFKEILAERNASGLVTTLYSCTEHKPGNFSLSAPVESYWSAVNAGKAGTAGFRRWAYDAWVADPLNDATHNAFEPGDCFLVYPSEKDAAMKTAKSSVRLERMAEGIRDVNKLRILQEKMPSLSSEIEAVYNRVTMTATTGRTYLTEAEITSLAEQMNSFKSGVAELTEKYLASKNGAALSETSKTLNVGESWKVPVALDDALVFRAVDPAIASVDAGGNVTANRKGSTVIIVENKNTGYTGSVQITVTRTLIIKNTLTDYKLPEQYLSDIERDPDDSKGRHYLGQPDMVMLDDEKTLITVYPVGHGRGSIVMQVSRDAGESWTEKTDIPASWSSSYETPTMYKLNMTDGSTKLILISGRPANFGAPTGGWDSSISTDGGETWTEYQTYWENFSNGTRNETVVAMASMIQMKDEDGNLIDKWMAVYHNGSSFVNYKTYLTFDEQGNQQWTEPVPYLSEYRSIESRYQMCEIGMFRSPDGKRIIGLARSQSHANPATMIYSDDEGETWSKPMDLPGSLAGERHKIMYDPTDPTGQRMIVTFREIQYDREGNDNTFGSDWMAGDWIAWVGTYDDIMNQNDGQYRILLCEDWAANAKSGDTGYTGMAVLSDGTFILDTYGHWDKEWSQSLKPYNVYNDQCWIKQAKFKLSDLDSLSVSPASEAKEKIQAEINNAPHGDASNYTEASWNAYQQALAAATSVKEGASSTNLECYHALSELQKARMGLLSRDTVDVVIPDDTTEARNDLGEMLKQAENYTDETKYTSESWKAYQAALKKAQEVQGKDSSTKEEIMEALKDLETAIGALKPAQSGTDIKPPVDEKPKDENKQPPQNTQTAKDGQIFDSGNYRYKVISAADQTVEVTGLKNTRLAKITIYNTVSLGGKSYKVTSVAASAFKGNKKVTGVTIGKNVQSIGKNAFSGCVKLKKVTVNAGNLKQIGANAFFNCKKLTSLTIKSKALKKVGKNALKGIHKKAVIKVPASKRKAYTKLLAKKGQSATVKIK